MDDKDLLLSSFDDDKTQTIELDNLLTQDLTPSGSFRLGRIPATTFGKLLQALPIPALLVDRSLCVAFANESCGKIDVSYEETEGVPFSSLFTIRSASKKAQAVLKFVFSTRKPRIIEATMKIGKGQIWARLNFRSLRMGKDRLILVLVEDLTGEKKRLLHKQEHNERLSREIRQRKLAEEQVRQQNESLNNILEALTHPFYIIKADDYTIHRANTAAISAGYCNGSTCYSVSHRSKEPCDEGACLCPIEEIKKTGRPLVAEHVHYDKTGSLKHVEVHAYPIFNSEGSVVQIIEYCLDITDRKKMEEALHESEKRYRELFENASDLMYTHDLEGNYTSVNRAATKISGYSPSELVKLNFRDIVDPEHWHVTQEQLRKKIEEGVDTTGPYELLIRAKDGSPHWVEVNSRIIRKDDKPVGVQGMARDITERRKMEEALRAGEARYREVVEKANDIIFLTDENGIVGLVNPVASRITGYSEEELVGKHYLDLIRPDHKKQTKKFYRMQFVRKLADTYCEVPILTKNGETVWLGQNVSIMMEADKIVSHQVIARDITDRKRAEDALRESEEKYRIIFENSPLGVFHFDHDGIVTTCNDNFVSIIGSSKQKLLGLNVLSGLHNQEAVAAIKKALSGKIGHFEGLYRSVTTDKITPLKASFGPIVTKDGSVVGGIGILEDCTDLNKAKAFQIQTERLKAVADLASGVAHNFNNLLQIIMGGAQLASLNLELENVANVRRHLEQILESSKFGAETVKRLQSFANLQSEPVSAESDTFDLSDLVRQAVEMTKPWWKTTPEREGITINLNLELVDGCLVRGKQNELFEVVVNLIKNAAEALPRGGEINVATYASKKSVIFRVDDTGVGIAQEFLPRVFEPFWTTKGPNGTGMGLAVSYGIVTRHAGTITAESRESHGSSFTVKLPLAKGFSRDTASAHTAFDLKLKILAIDDMQLLLSMLREGLTECGQTVFTALSGREGLELFKQKPVDVVICDLGMPDLNGWQVGKTIKNLSKEKGLPKIPFVLLTGWAGQFNEEEKMIESGVDAIVEKPVDITKLMEIIRDVVKHIPPS
ncbi:MAG: PAS domain S-box protein [Desulfomonilaceae bacterium]